MNRKKTLMGAIIIVTLMLISSISYLLLGDRDAYKYYTGLGSGLAISDGDQLIAFSYFNNGKSAIYTAGQDGKNVKRVSNPKEVYHLKPQFSPDGSKILYLSQDRDHIQSLYIANVDGANPKKLSDHTQHISGAPIRIHRRPCGCCLGSRSGSGMGWPGHDGQPFRRVWRRWLWSRPGHDAGADATGRLWTGHDAGSRQPG